MGLWAVVAGAMARHEHSSPQGMTNRPLRGGNGGSREAPIGPIGKSVGRIRRHFILRGATREGFCINAGPKADLSVRVYAVVWRPEEGVELSGFESVPDHLPVDGNAGVEKATACPSGKAVRQESGFHDGPFFSWRMMQAICWSSTNVMQSSKPRCNISATAVYFCRLPNDDDDR